MTAAPQASGRWMLQHARAMRNDPANFLVACAAEFGDIVQFPIPRQSVFFVNEPEAVLRILQGNHPAYGKRTVQYRSLALVTGEGLLVSDGDSWRTARRRVQPAFHSRTLAAMGTHVADATERLIDGWAALPDGAEVDVDEAMMRVTLEIVGQALFDTDLGPDAGALVAAVARALDAVIARARSPVPIPLWLPTPNNARLGRSVRTLDRAADQLIARRLHAEPVESTDLLGLLLASGFTDEQVRDEVITLIVAGHETVASALTWALWLISGDPLVGERLAQESRRVLAGRRPTADDYAALTYTRQVFDEALRLYPPAWVLTRRTLADDVLAGVKIPAGALVIASTYALHRNPEIWDRAEVFDPDRFTAERRSQAVRGDYLPFGAGPRLCVGRDFALVEGALVLAALAGRFGWERAPGQTVSADAMVTIRPRGGLRLRLRSPG